MAPYASDLNEIFKDETKYVRLSIWFYRHLLQKPGDWRRCSQFMFWNIFIQVFCGHTKREPLEIPPLCSHHQNQFSLSPGGLRLFIWIVWSKGVIMHQPPQCLFKGITDTVGPASSALLISLTSLNPKASLYRHPIQHCHICVTSSL